MWPPRAAQGLFFRIKLNRIFGSEKTNFRSKKFLQLYSVSLRPLLASSQRRLIFHNYQQLHILIININFGPKYEPIYLISPNSIFGHRKAFLELFFRSAGCHQDWYHRDWLGTSILIGHKYFLVCAQSGRAQLNILTCAQTGRAQLGIF